MKHSDIREKSARCGAYPRGLSHTPGDLVATLSGTWISTRKLAFTTQSGALMPYAMKDISTSREGEAPAEPQALFGLARRLRFGSSLTLP